MVELPVSNATKLLLLDNEDASLFEGKTFYSSGNGYVHIYTNRCIFVHRMVIGVHEAPPCVMVDHKDHNGFNCQKSNLRICNMQQNAANSGARITSKSGMKGVCWEKRSGKWRSTITYNGKQIHIGLFDDIITAARAYDKRARFLFGEFAFLNFPELIDEKLEEGILRKTTGKFEWHQQSVVSPEQQLVIATNHSTS